MTHLPIAGHYTYGEKSWKELQNLNFQEMDTKKILLIAPSNPCHDLVFTHKEQIPKGKKKKSQKKKRRRSLEAKLKGKQLGIM